MFVKNHPNQAVPLTMCHLSTVTLIRVILFIIFLTSFGSLQGQEVDEDEFSKLFEKGYTALTKGNLEEGIRLFKQCLEIDETCTVCAYNVACAYSLQQNIDQAFHWLFKAVDVNFDLKHMDSDPDLDNLRSDPRYIQVVKKYFDDILGTVFVAYNLHRTNNDEIFQLFDELIDLGYPDLQLESIQETIQDSGTLKGIRQDARYPVLLNKLQELASKQQEINNKQGMQGRLERAVQLIVMIEAKLDGEDTFGAGIICGRENDRLYIVTANHVIREGKSVAKNIQVKIKDRPNTLLEAKPMEHADTKLDVAVVAVENLSLQGVEFCKLPLNHLGNASLLTRGEAVYPIGNPNAVSWGMPVKPDAISMLAGDEITFQSSFIYKGHSGGVLLTERGEIVGMINADAPPFGRAINFDKVLELLHSWGYPVQLRYDIVGDQTPLHEAVEKGDLREVKRQLYNCLDTNTLDNKGRSPLHIAAAKAQAEISQLLIDAGANVNLRTEDPPDSVRRAFTSLHLAAAAGAIDVMDILMKNGASMDAFLLSPDYEDEYELTPLHLAVEGNHVGAVRSLLKHGAASNISAPDVGTPLHVAAKHNATDIIELLLASGANVNDNRSENDMTPLHHAAANNAVEAAELLLSRGADVDAKDRYGHTPSRLAIERGYNAVLKLLSSHGTRQ